LEVGIYKIYTYAFYYVENIIMLCTINTTYYYGERDAFYTADYAQCVSGSILSCLYDSAVRLYQLKCVSVCGKIIVKSSIRKL